MYSEKTCPSAALATTNPMCSARMPSFDIDQYNPKLVIPTVFDGRLPHQI
jgi:hypothetical protein